MKDHDIKKVIRETLGTHAKPLKESYVTKAQKYNLNTSLLLKYRGQTRDYGGADVGFIDQFLDEYLLVDLLSSYDLSESYKVNFSIKNITDKNYENAFNYTGAARTMNIGLKKNF